MEVSADTLMGNWKSLFHSSLCFILFRRNHNHIWQVLMYARRVFYKIDTTSPLNPEAAVL